MLADERKGGRMRRKKIATVIAIIVLLAMITGCGKASSTFEVRKTFSDTAEKGILENGGAIKVKGDDLAVQISYGSNKTMEGGVWIPFHIQITNEGEAFDGTVAIVLPNSDIGAGLAYKKEFSIEKDASAEIVIKIPNVGNFSKLQFQILEGEQVKVDKVLNVGSETFENQSQLLTGILTEEKNSLNYFDELMIDDRYGTFTKIVEFDEETFPTKSSELSSMAFLVINQFSTEQLSKEQLDAVMEWVEQGGVLIVGTGMDPEEVFRGFPKGYFVEAVGTAEEKNISLVGDEKKETIFVAGNQLTVAHAKKMTNLIKGGNLWQLDKGNGSVVVADFDLGSSAIDGWGGKGTFAETLCKQTISLSTEMNLNNRYIDQMYGTYIQQALNFYRGIQFPKTAYYIFLFTLYVLIIGPIGYFLLKKKDKREWIWVLIPVTAFVFNGVIFLTSTESRLKSPVATTITMVDSSSTVWKEKIYAAFMNSGKKSYEIPLSPSLTNIMPIAQNDYVMYNGKQEFGNLRYSVEEGEDKTTIAMEKGKAFSSEYLTMEQVEKKEQTGFQKDLNYYMNDVSGTVTNQTGYDLIYAGIIYNGMYVPLGAMKNGETVSIDRNRIEAIQNKDSYRIADLVIQKMPMKTKEDRTIRHQLFNICNFFGSNFETMKSGEGYIFGLAEQYEQGYITNSEIIKEGRVFFYEPFEQQPEDAGDYYVQNIFENLTHSSESNLNSYDNSLYGGYDEAQYVFDTSYEITRITASSVTSSGVFEENGVHIYAWNYREKRYEEIFKNALELTKEQIERYMNKNEMKLKFESQEDWAEIPIISVSGVEVVNDAGN